MPRTLLRSFSRSTVKSSARELSNSYALDSYTAGVGIFALKRHRLRYAGHCCRIRRNQDNELLDVGFTPDGWIDTAAITAFLAGSSPASTVATAQIWYNQSGNGLNASQTTAGSQAVFAATGLGGKPALTFDGTDDFFTLGTPSAFNFIGGTNSFSVFGAWNLTNSGSSLAQVMLGKRTNSDCQYVFFTSETNSDIAVLVGSTSGSKNFVGTVIGSATAAGVTVATSELLGYEKNVAVGTAGTVQGTGTSTADVDIGARISTGTSRTGFLRGNLGGLFVVSEVPSTANRALLFSTLQVPYGIS